LEHIKKNQDDYLNVSHLLEHIKRLEGAQHMHFRGLQ
jgi:hypothetical protein